MGQFIEKWMPTNLLELREALDEIEQTIASLSGDNAARDPEVIYVNVRHLSLVAHKLTDGSSTFDIVIQENK